jgi:UDP-glucose 4-epimerase
VLRLTNVYGPRMRVKDARQTFVGVWLRAVIEGRPFEVWGGEQIRDFTYVDDVVAAMLLAAERPETDGQVFNLGGHGPVRLRALAEMLAAAAGGSFERREFPAERKRIDIGDFYADDRAFRAATGWQPAVPLAEGLARSVAYYRAHLAHYL